MASPVQAMPILIVDDNQANLKVARILLESEGYKVLTAEDADEALAVLARHRPPLILMDIQLPGMDGLELTRKLKAQAETADTIILALTAYAMKGDEERALAAGCDGYITKPIDTRSLPALLAGYLRGHRATRKGPISPAPGDGNFSAERLEHLGATSARGKDQVHEIIEAFTASTETGLQTLRRAVRAGDVGLVRRTAHAIGGWCGDVGAADMARRCGELAVGGVPAHLDGLLAVIDALERDFTIVRAALLSRWGSPTPAKAPDG